MTTTDATEISREIKYSRTTRDYDCYVNGQYVGSARNYSEGEALCDQVAFDLIADGQCLTAAQLDGGSDPDDCAVDVEALVIRGEDPTRVSAVLAHREEINFRQRCLLCGGDHSAEDCPRIHPIDATALLEEADAVIDQVAQHPGPNCYCPDCLRRAVVLTATSYVTKLRFDAGLICQYCGEDHADSDCTQTRSLLAPRVCGNCQGRHSIQACDEIRAALFAA